MAKNNLASLLAKAKDDAYTAGAMDGMLMGLDLAVIALNHVDHYGEKRINRLNDYINVLYREIVDTADPDHTRHNIEKALKQIRGADFESGYIDPPEKG
jgi:hypothetical protein